MINVTFNNEARATIIFSRADGRSMSAAPFPRGAPVATGEFTINEFTRTRDDACEVAQNIRDSAGPGAYQVNNLVPAQAAAAKVEYPNPTLLGREGFGLNNAQIDQDSRLRNEVQQAGRQSAPYTYNPVPLPPSRIWATAVVMQTLNRH